MGIVIKQVDLNPHLNLVVQVFPKTSKDSVVVLFVGLDAVLDRPRINQQDCERQYIYSSLEYWKYFQVER